MWLVVHKTPLYIFKYVGLCALLSEEEEGPSVIICKAATIYSSH